MASPPADLLSPSSEEDGVGVGKEKEALIGRILELQNTLHDLTQRVNSVREENSKLKSENEVRREGGRGEGGGREGRGRRMREIYRARGRRKKNKDKENEEKNEKQIIASKAASVDHKTG